MYGEWMEKEHIYRDRERAGGRERERVTPEYLDATRESVELRSRPRDPFSTVLSSSSSCVQLVRVLPRRAFSRFLSRFARPPIYFHFFVVFAYGGRVIMVLYALLDPPSSFLLAKTNLPPPSPRLSLSRLALSLSLSPTLLVVHSSCVSFVPSAALVRPRPFFSSACNDKIVHFCQPPSAVTGFLRIAAGSIGTFLFLLSSWYIHIVFYAVRSKRERKREFVCVCVCRKKYGTSSRNIHVLSVSV